VEVLLSSIDSAFFIGGYVDIQRAAVIGGGSFGTVVANILADNQIQTVQWMRNEVVASAINTSHTNPDYLPGVALNPELKATTDLLAAVKDADVIFVSVPSHSVRQDVTSFAAELKPEQALISTTKGIEHDGFLLMSQV